MASSVLGSDLIDYLTEVQEIKSSVTDRGGKPCEHTSEDSNEEDEGEKEFEFLNAVGLEKVAKRIRAGEGIDEVALAELKSTLTADQAATVQRQASKLHETTHRRKLKPQQRRHVREIFLTDAEDGGGFSLPSSGKVEISPTKTVKKEEVVRISAPKSHSNTEPNVKPPKAKSPVPPKKQFERDGYFVPPSELKLSLIRSGVNLISVVPTGDRSVSPQSLPQKPQDKSAVVGSEAEEEEIIAVESPTANSFTKPSLSRRTRGCEDKCSVTYIEDYGKKDIKSIAKFSLLEVETKFDQHRIAYSKRKSKKKPKDQGVFGVPLQTLLDRDCKKNVNLQVPLVFQQLIEQLEKRGTHEVGLLRVPGNQTRIKALREELDSGQARLQNLPDTVTSHDLAGLLKLLLRELPTPLLTLERVDAFSAVLQITDEIERMAVVNLLLLTLPDVNRETLRLLLKYLREIVACPDNKMTVENVSLIMAPNLFLPGVLSPGNTGGSKLGSTEDELRAASETSSVVKLMINYQQALFQVPELIVSQVRNENEKKMIKTGVFSGKKDKGNTCDIRVNNSSNPISISVSLDESTTETLVPLYDKTTAYDVISYIMSPTKQPSRGVRESKSIEALDKKILENIFLFEVGGNIGERRLNHKVHMISVQERNPAAKYIIRTKRS